jgi:hypothetical protein
MGGLSGLHAFQQRATAQFTALVPPIPRLSFRLWVALRMVSALAP